MIKTFADAVAKQIMALQRTAPKTWRAIADTLIDVDPGELAALRAHPAASVLLDGDKVRAVGITNAVLNEASADVEAALVAQIQSLQERLAALTPP